MARLACGQVVADTGGGIDLAVCRGCRRDRGEAEAAVFRHARQQVGIAAALVPEYEIVSHDDVTGAESFDQREAHEILRRELRAVTLEALHDHHLDTEGRPEDQRVGTEGGGTGVARWSRTQ